jgi:hypothetical protein
VMASANSTVAAASTLSSTPLPGRIVVGRDRGPTSLFGVYSAPRCTAGFA